MVNFKFFIEALHNAIAQANETILERGESILDRFFDKTEPKDKTDPKQPNNNLETRLTAKNVLIQYPHLSSEGDVVYNDVSVPLITLVPHTATQIEKATLTIEFEMEEIDGELHLNFNKSKPTSGLFAKRPKTKWSSLEIVITPQETAEGVKILTEAYERMLKRQFS